MRISRIFFTTLIIGVCVWILFLTLFVRGRRQYHEKSLNIEEEITQQHTREQPRVSLSKESSTQSDIEKEIQKDEPADLPDQVKEDEDEEEKEPEPQEKKEEIVKDKHYYLVHGDIPQGGSCWYGGAKWETSINKILDNLYLGEETCARNKEMLESFDIDVVFNFVENTPNMFHEAFIYHKYSIHDSISQDLMSLFDEVMDIMEKYIMEGKKIFVHCSCGVSRSSSFVIAYLMKSQNMDYYSAFRFVKDKRRVIQPNQGFISQLRKYQQILKSREQ